MLQLSPLYQESLFLGTIFFIHIDVRHDVLTERFALDVCSMYSTFIRAYTSLVDKENEDTRVPKDYGPIRLCITVETLSGMSQDRIRRAVSRPQVKDIWLALSALPRT